MQPYLWSSLFPSRYPYQKRKGGQVRFSNDQTADLEKKFNSQKYLSPSERKKVAKKLQLSERQVSTACYLLLGIYAWSSSVFQT